MTTRQTGRSIPDPNPDPNPSPTLTPTLTLTRTRTLTLALTLALTLTLARHVDLDGAGAAHLRRTIEPVTAAACCLGFDLRASAPPIKPERREVRVRAWVGVMARVRVRVKVKP